MPIELAGEPVFAKSIFVSSSLNTENAYVKQPCTSIHYGVDHSPIEPSKEITIPLPLIWVQAELTLRVDGIHLADKRLPSHMRTD